MKEERKQLVLEVLTPIGYNFIVTPKEIDDLINELDSKLKSIEINKILDYMGFPINWKDLGTIEKKEIF